MAQYLKDVIILADGYDLSADSNNLTIAAEVADLDVTTFGHDSVVRVGGLQDWSVNAEGFWSALPDAALNARLGASSVLSVAPSNVSGSVSYSGTALSTSYELSGSVGEPAKFTLNAKGASSPKLARGTVALPVADYTASGIGDGFQLGALSSTQKLYAYVHVLGAPSGTAPTLDVLVQSAATNGFTSPTTQITMSGLTTGAAIGIKAGAVTNQWWRVSYTIGGTSPSFKLFIALAII